MELATLEKLDLPTLEKVCQIFFDQMGFTAKAAGHTSNPGVSGMDVLYSKTSNKPFALCQCAVRKARVDLDLLGQFRDSLARLKLASGYFITCGSTDQSLKEFAAANKINLLDCLKLTELINNLPESSRNQLAETIVQAQAQADNSGGFRQMAAATGRHRREVDLGVPPNCAKCGLRMKLQVSMGKNKTGKYWQCPNPACGYISALF